MMKFDHSKLLGRMRERGYTQESLAKSIGINESTMNSKLNGKTYFTTKEIDMICKLLDISTQDIGLFFYSISLEK